MRTAYQLLAVLGPSWLANTSLPTSRAVLPAGAYVASLFRAGRSTNRSLTAAKGANMTFRELHELDADVQEFELMIDSLDDGELDDLIAVLAELAEGGSK